MRGVCGWNVESYFLSSEAGRLRDMVKQKWLVGGVEG
jgi:hypothetical protein